MENSRGGTAVKLLARYFERNTSLPLAKQSFEFKEIEKKGYIFTLCFQRFIYFIDGRITANQVNELGYLRRAPEVEFLSRSNHLVSYFQSR